MYDQYKDGEISYFPIYLFALEFVVTALTTVGYGSHTYGMKSELIFVAFIEVLSAIYTASLISLVVKFERLSIGNSFNKQVSDFMNKRDEWLFYKLQRLGKPYYLSSSLSWRI